MAACVIRIYFLDGSYKSVPVHSWVTGHEMATGLAKAIGIQDDRAFALFAVSTEDDEEVVRL